MEDTVTIHGTIYNVEEVRVLEKESYWLIDSPATGTISIPRDGRWTFDGNFSCPTFYPSINESWGRPGQSHDELLRDPNPNRNHCWIRHGKIEYLSDCTHEMRGQTVEIPPIGKSRVALCYLATPREAS